MFNDERITLDMAKFKKIIILVSSLIALVFLLVKLFYKIVAGLSFYLYSTELIIVLTSIVTLIGSLFIKAEVKDEAFIQRKAHYYNKAFKIFLYISFISYAVVIPAIIKNSSNSMFSSNVCINIIMLLILFFGYGYLRIKKIYFNYNIIEEDSKIYWKNVFKNILKILMFFGIIYGVAMTVSFFYLMISKGSFIIILGIIIAFIVSVIGNGVYYIFISFLERLFIKEDDAKKIKTPTIILLSITTLFLIISIVINILYNLISLRELPIPDGMEFSEAMSKFSEYNRILLEYSIYFGTLGGIFLVSDLMKIIPKKRGKLIGILISFIIFIISQIVEQATRNILISAIGIIYDTDILKYGPISDMLSYGQAITFIVNLLNVFKILFYITIPILILVFFIKELCEHKIFMYLIILLSLGYFGKIVGNSLRGINYIYISSTILIVSYILVLLFIVLEYAKSNNKIEN